LPTLRLLARSPKELHVQGEELVDRVRLVLGNIFTVAVADCASQIGSGALPLETLPSAALAIRPVDPESGSRLESLAAALRRLPVPIIGRIENQALMLDLRCLEDESGFLESLSRIELPP
ncbi:L-seryl-tRNA(Sec) selenium transferase, partial [Rhizobiaceae sp. 2RAB30]